MQTLMVGRGLFALLFITAGVSHFLRPAMFVAIVPPYLPAPEALVYISGATEILLGALLLVRRWSSLAAWGLIGLLIAVFPANVQMAISALRSSRTSGLFKAGTIARLPLQVPLIRVAVKAARG